VELEDGLVVEGDGVHARGAGLGEAVAERRARKAVVVLPAREALLLRGGDDPPVLDQAGGGVVVEAAEAEDLPVSTAVRAKRSVSAYAALSRFGPASAAVQRSCRPPHQLPEGRKKR
jgi:hypothetical protein